MTSHFLIDGPEDADVTLLFAHGAGAPMDSAAMNAAAKALVLAGIRIARFEFGYMAARRSGQRKPPPKAETLTPEYLAAIDDLGAAGDRLFIGGKSMGGRVASMVADTAWTDGKAAGLVCLGYPFHPPGKPAQLRTAHLEKLETPALIVQGTRDPFGTREEVGGYALSPAIKLSWLADGDHDLRPRKSVSGFSAVDHMTTMGQEVAGWMRRVAGNR
ncbi:hypothetical protein SAMN06295905_0803 [Devosia lucknowensis]|uniref:KANL3/Tex30 alpha/beta hydrolase-like domain-containing protein n=1 Tax=Devosia lucknowensis TaxID=1096929 RepID=A0A1Y6EQZ7_9HYPH|nr:alpha/beta family hydrolase [Devosia lucknowensis]SMQ63370.1 hypothetical protein SAMN06295905_0803 [Devosia lucknowensis]